MARDSSRLCYSVQRTLAGVSQHPLTISSLRSRTITRLPAIEDLSLSLFHTMRGKRLAALRSGLKSCNNNRFSLSLSFSSRNRAGITEIGRQDNSERGTVISRPGCAFKSDRITRATCSACFLISSMQIRVRFGRNAEITLAQGAFLLSRDQSTRKQNKSKSRRCSERRW